MKRKWIAFVAVVAASVFASVLTVFAQSPPSSCPKNTCGWTNPPDSPSALPTASVRQPAKPAASSEQVIDELATILKETKSPETFLVTTGVLARMGPEARRTLPVIIRNAERLELLEDLYDTNAASTDHIRAQEILTALEMMVENKSGARMGQKKQPMPTYAGAVPATPYAIQNGYAPTPAMPPAPTGYPAPASYGSCSAPSYGYGYSGGTPLPPQAFPGSTTPALPSTLSPASSLDPTSKPVPKQKSSRADERLTPTPCNAPGLVVN